MPLPVSHVLGRKRHFAGENEAYSVMEWLNTTELKAAKARVLELQDLMRELVRTNTAKGNVSPHDETTPWNILRARINKKLLRYPFCHQLIWFRHPYFLTGLRPLWTGGATDVRFSEAGAVFATLLVFQQPDGWRRIAQCDCQKYYFRRFSHQRFCGEPCRLKKFHASEKWKEYRRNKAREYYWLHKNANVK